LSLVRISKGKWKRRPSSSCHCSAKLPGQTMRQRLRSPRAISSLMKSPTMIVLPEPGSTTPFGAFSSRMNRYSPSNCGDWIRPYPSSRSSSSGSHSVA
jgi:hypothetical protein